VVWDLNKKPSPDLALIGDLGDREPDNIAIENQPVSAYENDDASEADTEETSISASQPKLYSSSKYNFSFQLPDEFAVSELTEKNGDIVLVQGPGVSFQIFVILFEEREPLTPERIKRDVPDLAIENPAYINVDGVEALSFYSREQNSEKAYEVWMVSKNWLYQVMINANQKELALDVLKTWQFK